MRANLCFVALLLMGQFAGFTSPTATAAEDPVMEKATVKVKDEAKIPAMEAGVLTKLNVREGARVKKDDVIAVIDDREAKARLKIAKYAELGAWKLVEQDIEERYARAAAELAEADLKKDLEANRNAKGAVAESEIARKRLDAKRAKLQIEKAGNDRVIASYDAKTKTAERKAAEMALEWRTISAPFDGDVVKTFVHQSEWVQPGDPILKLMRFDKMYVEGRILAGDFDRSEVLGKSVTVEVTKAHGRQSTVTGVIVHADPILKYQGEYTVRAEVGNKLVNDSWLLQPDGVVRMTIHLSQESRVQGLEPAIGRR